MRVIDVCEAGYEAAARALKRDTLQDNPRVEAIVRDIVEDVKTRGDVALLELGRRFDSPELAAIEVDRALWDEAEHRIPNELKEALRRSALNIAAFHDKQLKTSWLDAQPDRITGQLLRALDKVGVYVPGGTAAYPSTVLMTAIPARVVRMPIT